MQARRPKLPPAYSMLILTCSGLRPRNCASAVLVAGLQLLAVPDFAAVGVEPDHAVHRLHRGVRQIGEVVRRADDLGRAGKRFAGVAGLLGDQARGLGQFLVAGQDFVAAQLEGGALVPAHDQRVAALLGAPGVVGEHRDALRNLHHIDHALDRLRLARIERLDLGPEQRRMGNHGNQHAGQEDVLREACRTVGLGRAVLALGLLADQAEILAGP